MRFFAPNIGRGGRTMRAVIGLACIVGGLLLYGTSTGLCVLLIGAGVFAFFEAARGWCLARACGLKTRL